MKLDDFTYGEERDEEDLTDEINQEDEEQFRRIQEFRRIMLQQPMNSTVTVQQNQTFPAAGIGEIGAIQGLQVLQNLTQPMTEPPLSPGVTVEASQYQRFAQITQPTNTTEEISDEVLIDTVKLYPIIWGASGKKFKDTEKKNRAWIEIGKNLHSERK